LMEANSITELPSTRGHQKDLDLVLLKGARIAEAMLQYHNGNSEQIAHWLATVREEFKGRTFRHEDLIAIARNHEITVEPFLTDWLTSSSLPGFVASKGSVSRLEDSDDGKRRLQVSFSVRNTEPVGGFVTPLFGKAIRPIYIDANTAKRINLVWENAPIELDSLGGLAFPLTTGLSLNRENGLTVVIGGTPVKDVQSRETVEDSNWTQEQEGIVVDDLDEGFSVHRPSTSLNKLRPTSLDGWFRPQIREFEHDEKIPEIGWAYMPIFGEWSRTQDSFAHGLHRRTLAIARVGRDKFLNAATFSAEIPQEGRWILDFHVLNPYLSFNFKPSDLILRVDAGSRLWDIEFDPTTENAEWKTVGEFDLTPGTVQVHILGGKRRSVVYADAIRWQHLELESSEANTP
ncbi:MAG: hypothetical protein OXG24_10310, partial [Gammaproteobacteria bacterium]|nr:hypothetical protein [Gammaproteobacteria bacterium]